MGLVMLVLLVDRVFVVALVLVLLVILIWLLLRKKVVVPNLTVAVDKPSYLHGAPVQIRGTLTENDEPVEGEEIAIKIKGPPTVEDPEGKIWDLESVTTDEEGKYAQTWEIPSEGPPGTYTLTASGLGVFDTTTFTHNAVTK